VSTDVIQEDGRFVVVIEVLFADGDVRHRLGEYHTRARAESAARMFYRSAQRGSPSAWP